MISGEPRQSRDTHLAAIAARATAPAFERPRSIFRSLLAILRWFSVNFLIFAVLAELMCVVFVHRKSWPSTRPTYHLNYNQFWADIYPAFGTWHRPDGPFTHQGGCFSVEYRTNSYGARDSERNRRSMEPRTIVLGDSFVEGFGLSDEQRLSNILERRTGREHLNFGSGGNFSPLQYFLVYKSMAQEFDHDLVVVGVLPDNDFHEMDLTWGRKHLAGRYRPYYAKDLSIVYEGRLRTNTSETTWDHVEAFLRAYLASYHVGQYLNSLAYWHSLTPYSGYNDYDDVDLTRLKKALSDLGETATARGSKVAVFLIPRLIDFERLQATGSNRLGPAMEQWGQQAQIPIKDLLPEMARRSQGDYRSYFLPCDGHWSKRGNEVAAEIVGGWLYGRNPVADGQTLGKP
jgi:hypothetical protein